jgi:hypothetical protein
MVKLYIFAHTIKIYCLFRVGTRDIAGQFPLFFFFAFFAPWHEKFGNNIL